uniref:Mitochondrial carrier protein n=1 Tax=Aureoumbra lagunensis TaxID=44058 RepID=A0A7S3K3J8_9STRA|mmetsp:Transcript_14148/g.18910  ORF Transcript_14148/g.18910 Transcript_14148/m.18910 type:complete len:350 (-) Transcript_14148:88-1137(-)
MKLFQVVSIVIWCAESRKLQRTRCLALRGGGATSTTESSPNQMTQPTLQATPVFDAVVAGAVATVAGDVAMHPVDTVKTVQQASGLGPMAAIRSIRSSPRGLAAFYEGVVPYAISDGLSGAVKFAAYEKLKRMCDSRVSEEWIPATRFACAAAAFVACSVVLVPGELLKQRLQAGMYPGLLTGIGSIWTKEGPRAFFTGYGSTLVRDVPYTMLELGLYDLFKSAAIKTRAALSGNVYQESRQSDELIAAAVTGGIAGFATNPLDIIKTRMMTASAGSLTGPIAAAQILLKDGGPRAFFTGAGARVAWLMPFTTIYFGCIELTKRSLASFRAESELVSIAPAATGGNHAT